MFLPKIRNTDIILQEVGQELLIYDLKINKAYALNETLKIVYQSCDGETSYQDLKRQHHHLNDDVIKLAVNELSRENLLVERLENTVSRRKLLTHAALAATVALPVITVIVAPTAAYAQSGCLAGGAPCSVDNPGPCCSKMCDGSSGNPVCTDTCLAAGNPCSVLNPSACCSGSCDGSTGNPVCTAACTPNGGSCNVNNPQTCCSRACSNINGNPICVAV